MISFEKEGVLYDHFFKVTLVGTVMSLIFNLIFSRLWLAYPAAVINMLPKEIQAQAPKAELKQLCKLRWSLFSFLLFAYSSYWQMFLVNLDELIGLDWFFRKKYLQKLMILGTERLSNLEN